MDLLAKSVAKIQAADEGKSEEENIHFESELRKVEKRKSSDGKMQSKKRRKAVKLDRDDCKEKELRTIKDEETIVIKTESSGGNKTELIKAEFVETWKKEIKIRKDKSMRKQLTGIQIALVNVKTEYIEIKTENLDPNEKKCAKLEIKSEDKEELKVLLEEMTNDRSSSKKAKCHKRVSGTLHRIFKPEEDQVLLDAMEQFGDQIDYKQIAKDLQRTSSSIRCRVKKLKTGKSTRGHSSFTIAEDIVILDAVLQHLNGQSLEMLTLPQSEWIEIGVQIGRNEVSSRLRWSYRLRPWILQHYSGTLNLDIMRPLANFLAENFEDIQSIDWSIVNTQSEFAGHTEHSLRRVFYSGIFKLTKENPKKQSEDITLEMIAEFANTSFMSGGKKVLGGTLKRQQEIIDYFECYVKSKNIKNFL